MGFKRATACGWPYKDVGTTNLCRQAETWSSEVFVDPQYIAAKKKSLSERQAEAQKSSKTPASLKKAKVIDLDPIPEESDVSEEHLVHDEIEFLGSNEVPVDTEAFVKHAAPDDEDTLMYEEIPEEIAACAEDEISAIECFAQADDVLVYVNARRYLVPEYQITVLLMYVFIKTLLFFWTLAGLPLAHGVSTEICFGGLFFFGFFSFYVFGFFLGFLVLSCFLLFFCVFAFVLFCLFFFVFFCLFAFFVFLRFCFFFAFFVFLLFCLFAFLLVCFCAFLLFAVFVFLCFCFFVFFFVFFFLLFVIFAFFVFLLFACLLLAFGLLSMAFGGIFSMSNLHIFQYTNLNRLYSYIYIFKLKS